MSNDTEYSPLARSMDFMYNLTKLILTTVSSIELEEQNITYDACSPENPNFNCSLEDYLQYRLGPKQLALSTALPITIVYVVIFFTGVLGNIAVCVVIVRHASMHTATNYYLFCLAMSDLTLLLLVEKKVYSSNCSTMPKEKREAYILCRRGNKGVRYIRKDQSLSQPNMTLSNTYPTQRSLKKCGQDFRLVNSEPKMMCALGEPPNKPLQIIPLRNPETDQTIVPMQRQALKHLPSEINTIGRNICMQPTSSRRPIHCPIYGCKCTIAVSTIMAHFSGVHPQVSLVPIEPDSTVQIAFSISSIPPRDSTCVALLLLRGKKTLEQHLWPMPLLAHRKCCKKTPNIVNIRPEIGLRPSSTGGLRSSIDSQKTRGNLSPSSDSVSSIIASFNDPRYSKPVVTKSSNIDTNLVFCLLGLESIQMYYRLTALHTATKYSTFRGPVFLLNESQLERRQTECMVYRESIEHDSTRTGFITMEVRMDRGTQDPCCNEDTSRLPGR